MSVWYTFICWFVTVVWCLGLWWMNFSSPYTIVCRLHKTHSFHNLCYELPLSFHQPQFSSSFTATRLIFNVTSRHPRNMLSKMAFFVHPVSPISFRISTMAVDLQMEKYLLIYKSKIKTCIAKLQCFYWKLYCLQ